jgi:diguanylate cyclase (GGDEF)-like protein/PAS domain S-box-containing protein
VITKPAERHVGSRAGVALSPKLKSSGPSAGPAAIGRPFHSGERQLLDDLACPIIEVTPAGRLRFANPAAAAHFGLAADDVDLPLLDRLEVSLAEQVRIGRRLALLLVGRRSAVGLRLDGRPGEPELASWRVSAQRANRQRLVGFRAIAGPMLVGRGRDRSATLGGRPPAEPAAATPDWLWETDAGDCFTYLSERFEAITGIARARLVGRPRTEVMAPKPAPPDADRHADELAAHSPFHELTCLLLVDGHHRSVRLSGHPLLDSDGRFQGYRGVGWEAADGGHPAGPAAERLRYLVRHDPLTGLVNRQALGDSLAAALGDAKRAGGSVAFLALDFEAFKRVNDSYGHGIGDQLLQQAALRLRRSVAVGDTVGRLGGDEFAVIMPLADPDAATVVGIARRIAEQLRLPFGIEGHEIHCGVRIGITLSPLHGDDVPALLQQADLALHEAKRHDKGICVFGAELSAATQRRKSIEEALRRALARDEMSLVLQPQFTVKSQALVGCEALLRWRHGRPDEIGPSVFVPIAEETGLVVEFGSWVLNEACRLAAGWWQGGRGPRIAVNLSPVQFWNRDLCREVADALMAAKLPPQALELEITEGVLMRDTRSAADTLNKLNELGVAIALDDFGTGYSSLSYLKRFPIHRLKIDQTFIRDLDHDEDDRQIAKAIIGLGHSLNLEVVAEGVETPRHLAFLADLECDVAQGYLFAPPLTVSAFHAALQGHAWPVVEGHHRTAARSFIGGDRRRRPSLADARRR